MDRSQDICNSYPPYQEGSCAWIQSFTLTVPSSNPSVTKHAGDGALVNIRAPKQMGKTSIMTRILAYASSWAIAPFA
jgi:hypothetical protein